MEAWYHSLTIHSPPSPSSFSFSGYYLWKSSQHGFLSFARCVDDAETSCTLFFLATGWVSTLENAEWFFWKRWFPLFSFLRSFTFCSLYVYVIVPPLPSPCVEGCIWGILIVPPSFVSLFIFTRACFIWCLDAQKVTFEHEWISSLRQKVVSQFPVQKQGFQSSQSHSTFALVGDSSSFVVEDIEDISSSSDDEIRSSTSRLDLKKRKMIT